MDTITWDLQRLLISFLPDSRPLGAVSAEWCVIYRSTPDYKFWKTRPLFRPKYALPKHVAISQYSPEEYARWGNIAAVLAADFNPVEIFRAAIRCNRANVMTAAAERLPDLINESFTFASICLDLDAEFGIFITTLDMSILRTVEMSRYILYRPIPKILTKMIRMESFPNLSELAEICPRISTGNLPVLRGVADKLSAAAREKVMNLGGRTNPAAYNLEELEILRSLGASVTPDPFEYVHRAVNFEDEIMMVSTIMYVKKYGIVTTELIARMKRKGFAPRFIASLRAN